MRERINRLAKGIIDVEVPQIVVSPVKIEEVIGAGEAVRQDICLTSENSLHIKGLAYSSNIRVRVINQAFGGLRNHISYEVNTVHLEHGDVIKGSFYLVTNAGEKEIPYSFRVEYGNSGQILGGLKTAGDFMETACENLETALRLFEFQDFVDAPFMQDIHTRAIYDGLKGRGSRKNQLEQFLIGSSVKEPVSMTVCDAGRVYTCFEEGVEDTILISVSTWGHIVIEARADGDFIKLSRKAITEKDFTDGQFELSFSIVLDNLHRGKNFGCIFLSTYKESVRIPIEVISKAEDDTKQIEDAIYKIGYANYLNLRLDYETGQGDKAGLLKKMMKETESVRSIQNKDHRMALIQAELLILTNKAEKACIILDEHKDGIIESREERLEDYCYYQYLNLLTSPGAKLEDSLTRLVEKYLEREEGHPYLFFILLKLKPDFFDNTGALMARMKQLFRKGFCSPFLYTEAIKLFNQSPGLLRNLDSFERNVLYFGCKRGLIVEELALQAALLSEKEKNYCPFLFRIFEKLYEAYPVKPVLSAVCSMLIKGEAIGEKDFIWYERAIHEGLSLTRLYEYFLYSLPRDYHRLIPKEVLLYFSYDNELSDIYKAVLYENILSYMSPDLELYKEYEREIEQFAMEQLFSVKINRSLAVIYNDMIYRDIIDLRIARVLPEILKTHRVECKNPQMRYVIVRHEELKDESAYAMTDGVAYVPLFSQNNVLIFQDGYGNRFMDAEHTKEPVMDKPELEERCFEIYPDHTMLLLKACNYILKKEDISEEESNILQRMLGEDEMHSLYQKHILSKIIDCYQKRVDSDEEVDTDISRAYLLQLDKGSLTREERAGVCETLINQGYIREAYDMIKEYGLEGIHGSRLCRLCSKMILENLFVQDELLLKLSYEAFSQGKGDNVILDYLCEHFNGTAGQMYGILRQSVIEHVETYDLEERLLAQMLFSDTTRKADKVFDLYTSRKKAGETIVKAFFTMKSAEYFLRNIPSEDKVFTYLEGVINGTVEKEKIPTIYLLALTKYYSTLPKLEEAQKELCQELIDIIMSEGMIFPYFKALGMHIRMPEDIMDKGIIQYCGRKDSKIELLVRILPEEENFHSEDMKRVYQGIFVKQKILFEGETLEYQVYERGGEKRRLVEEGVLTCDLPPGRNADSRFACLNDMGLCLQLKEEESLKKKMKEYLVRNATVEKLFTLM